MSVPLNESKVLQKLVICEPEILPEVFLSKIRQIDSPELSQILLTTKQMGTTTAFALLKAMIELPSKQIIAKIYLKSYVMEQCEAPKGARVITDSPKWAEFMHEKKRVCIFVKNTEIVV